MKRVLSLLFASMLVFSLAIPVFANGQGGDDTGIAAKKKKKKTKKTKTHRTSANAEARSSKSNEPDRLGLWTQAI
jgi:hypothetical protein